MFWFQCRYQKNAAYTAKHAGSGIGIVSVNLCTDPIPRDLETGLFFFPDGSERCQRSMCAASKHDLRELFNPKFDEVNVLNCFI